VADSSGNSYLVGTTSSTGVFNNSSGPFQTYGGGTSDGFVAVVDVSAGLTAARYLGLSGTYRLFGIAQSSDSSLYVTASSTSVGSALLVSSYLEGSSSESGNGIAVTGSTVFVVGSSTSTDLRVVSPISPAGNQISGLSDAFITKIDLSAASPPLVTIGVFDAN